MHLKITDEIWRVCGLFAVSIAAFGMTPSLALAQREALVVDSCMLSIPAQSFKRVPAFLQATSVGKASEGIIPLADLFTQTAAVRMREMLGGDPSRLPEADSIVAWYGIYGEVQVTVRRNGGFSWKTAEWSTSADSLDRSSVKLINAVLDDLSKAGENIGWPENAQGDSLIFGLSLTAPRVTKEMKVEPVQSRQAFPAFSLAMPWASAVDYKRHPAIRFNQGTQRGKPAAAHLTFVIDKSGKVDMNTIREFTSPGAPRPMGDDRRYQLDFLEAVKDALRSATYKPANIGGCVVNQTVQQDFSFQIN